MQAQHEGRASPDNESQGVADGRAQVEEAIWRSRTEQGEEITRPKVCRVTTSSMGGRATDHHQPLRDHRSRKKPPDKDIGRVADLMMHIKKTILTHADKPYTRGGVETEKTVETEERKTECGVTEQEAEEGESPVQPCQTPPADTELATRVRSRDWKSGEGESRGGLWTWEAALHGERSELKDLDLQEVVGETEDPGEWAFHDAYAGIGGASEGWMHAGGVCTGAFEGCGRAREVYERRIGSVPDKKWGSFDASSWGKAEVLFSSPPCEASFKGDDDSERQAWAHLSLAATHNYKVMVFEVLLHFKRMQNGAVYMRWIQHLGKLGYVSSSKLQHAPDFGAVAGRRRLIVVAVRRDVHKARHDFVHPIGTSVHHPVDSILESDWATKSRRDVRLRGLSGEGTLWFAQVRQRSKKCLKAVGEIKGVGPGRVVYSQYSSASTQTIRGTGPGGTTGAYLINGRVSRLTIKEGARALQIGDDVELDAVEAVARRQIGNSTPVGTARAVGLAVKDYLGVTPQKLPVHEEAKRASSLTQGGQAGSAARHNARLAQWAALAAAKAAAERSMLSAEGCAGGWTCFDTLSSEQLAVAKKGVQAFHNRRWIRLQIRRGEWEVEQLRLSGASAQLLRRARLTIQKALFMERMRAGNEEGPINLLWWNWSGPVPQELIQGYKLPLRRPPPSVFPDNYDTANVEKVWEEISRMKERGYMEGPFDQHEGKIYMSHPLAAVAKKGTDKLRLVIDMTATMLNECLIAQRFILPQVQDVVDHCYPGAWLMTCDLQDGFYGIEVCEEDRMYLGLQHPKSGKWYRYTRLAMGAACSPAAFSRLVAWAMKEAEKYPEFGGGAASETTHVVENDDDPHMPRVYVATATGEPIPVVKWFVDDGCLIGPTKEAVEAAYERLRWVLESRLGWRIAQRKTCGPCQRLNFCGLEIDTVGKDVGGPCIRLSEERKAKCLAEVVGFIEQHYWRKRAPRREMASLVGALSFASNAIPAGRCFLSRMYRAIHEVDQAEAGDTLDYDRDVQFTTDARLDMRWWQQCLEEAECVAPWRTKTFALHRLWSDASNYGFAEALAVEEHEGMPRMQFSHGVWPESVAPFSSNFHELATIVHSIKAHFETLRNTSVHFMTDNSTSVKAVNTGVVHSPQLMKLSRELKLLQARGNIGVEAIHLPGTMMMMQGTDQASRACPWMGMYSGKGGSHDLYAPTEWPKFALNGSIVEALAEWADTGVQRLETVDEWYRTAQLRGQDSHLHLRPCHVAPALERLLEAQLLEPATTAFTVVAPMVGLHKWRKYLKHFRRKEVHKVVVQGLGEVKHWLLRFEAGDGLLPRKQVREGEEDDEDEELE